MPELIETDIGLLPLHWEVIPFNKALKVKGRVGWKGYKTSDLRNEGPVVVGGTNIKANLYLDFSQTTYLSREKFEESPEIMLQKGDVILVTRGNGIGDVGYYDGQFSEATINPSLVILSQFVGNSKYLFYYLNSPQGRAQVLSIEGGTSIPALYQGYINTLLCPIPTEKEQEFIVDILNSIDEKIDLLHRQNKTLEQLLETLFRQWFVEEAEESWEIGTIDDVVSVAGGTTPSTSNSEFWNGDINWTSPKDLSNASSIFLFDTERKITNKGLAQIGSGLLPTGTVLLSSRAPIGYLSITEIPVAINQGYIAIICDKIVSNYFMFLWCRANIDIIENAGNGSVFQEISKASFKSLEFVIPPVEKLNYFNNEVDAVFNKIKSNNIQIRTLSQLRDTLLPKLMSGEVRIN
jgi:type I restriction enzyme, S subunit